MPKPLRGQTTNRDVYIMSFADWRHVRLLSTSAKPINTQNNNAQYPIKCPSGVVSRA